MQQEIVLAILALSVGLWVSEVIPLFVTSLLASFLLMTVGGFPTQEVLAPYFDPVIVLFLGGFLLAQAMHRHHLDHYAAQLLLSRIGQRPSTFLLGMMYFTAFLSLWMSNTAAAALMIPIAVFILAENGMMASGTPTPFGRAMILGVAYAATLGGIGSLIGSPPNAIAAKFLKEQGIQLSFLDWMIYALPFVTLAILVAWGVLIFLNRPQIDTIQFEKMDIQFTFPQKKLLGVFVVTVAGWLTTSLTGLSSSQVALGASILLFMTKILDAEDLHKISWETLLLFGGGLSLGNALTKVGIGDQLVIFVESYLVGIPSFFMLFGFILLGVVATMVASNTAAAAILIPLAMPLADPLGMTPLLVAMVIAMGVSLDFMIPVGTPPSAIAHSTGLVRVPEMVRNGILVNFSTSLLLATLFYFFFF